MLNLFLNTDFNFLYLSLRTPVRNSSQTNNVIEHKRLNRTWVMKKILMLQIHGTKVQTPVTIKKKQRFVPHTGEG